MADCECVPKCPFFNDRMANMPQMAALMKSRYCQGDKLTCARYQVKSVLGPEGVPSDLFPNQHERAQTLIAEPRR